MKIKQFYYKKNRMQQLKGFYYAVQTGSISKSAEKMNLSQAAITLQIQSLERDLGMKLFNREGKKIKLTKEGRLLYSHAIFYIQGLEGLFESFADFINNSKENKLDIAANHVGISYILPNYLKKFKTDNPNVKFSIRNLSKEDGINRLINGDIDMFIYPMLAEDVPQELEFIPIAKYQPILLTKKDHPLATKKDLVLNDVSKYELVRIDPKFITLPGFEEIIKAHGLKTKIEFEMSDWEILKKFVKADIGVAIISNIVLEGERNDELTGRILTNYFPEMTYGVMLKKEKLLNDLQKDFVQLLTKEKLLQAHQININN